MINFFASIWDFINSYLLIFSLLTVGVFYLVLFKGIQLSYFKHAFSLLYNDKTSYDDDKINITPMQSFLTGLAARIGMGNIAGVATAIAQGGPGAVFWMWVAAFLGMGTSFVENSLGQLFKTKVSDGHFVGGPAYYIRYGLKSKTFAIVFSLLLAFTYGFAFVSLQSNQISDSLSSAFGVSNWVTALLLLFLVGLIIFSTLNTISRVSAFIIPIMSTVYVLLALFILVWHFYEIPRAFYLIFQEAFTYNAAAGGALGAAINYGVKRGLFSNEAGMGSSPNIAASANVKHPVSQGFVQMMGIFFDTFVLCSLTALIVIISGVYQTDPELLGAGLAQASIYQFLGEFGEQLLVVLIFLFAFTSVIGYYVYGSVGITYVTENKTVANAFRIGVLAFTAWGAYSTPTLVWNVADIFMAFITFLNVIAILYLWRSIQTLFNDYKHQLQNGIPVPVFNIENYPDLEEQVADPTIWQSKRHHEVASTKG